MNFHAADVQPLSKLLRMAVVAGVESAVQIHIDRGDDLNARDAGGMTPLMLSAARNRPGICRLLIVAGANPDLLDPLGRKALEIAEAAGATEAASVIRAACMPSSNRVDDFLEPWLADPHQDSSASNEAPATHGKGATPPQSEKADTSALEPAPAVTTAAWGVDDDSDKFDLEGWEAEEPLPPPAEDPTVVVAAVEIQTAITDHQPIDTSADWDDFEAFLPERATPLPRAGDAEARERLRLVLLRAIREGSVPHSDIEALTGGEDGAPNAEASALLAMVLNDLGAETDERFEYSAPHENFEVFVAPDERAGEEEAVAEALAFMDDLVSRHNEPLRFYQRDLQREALLTAEAEIALGQTMERGVEWALDALAVWPAGVGAVLVSANQVAKGVKPLRWMSSGPQVESHEEQPACADEDADAGLEVPAEAEVADTEEDSDAQLGLDPKQSNDEFAEFCAKAELLSGLPIGTRQDAPEWGPCRDTLASLGLTRGFLMELADAGIDGESDAALAFAKAMQGYRRARDRMALANLKLVYSIAKKYLFSREPLDDLLQEGNIGLIKAVDRYDWRRGFRFSTYATWWIRQQVGRYVADKGKTVRLPTHVYEQTQRIAQVTHAFELRHSHEPSTEEIASLVSLPVHKVAALCRLGLQPLPLHELPDIDGLIATHAKDQFTGRDAMELLEDIELGDSLDRFLSVLRRKEANILRMRFGIDVPEMMTLEEVGARLDLTRERIRQIEVKAIERLRHPARLEKLLYDLGEAPRPLRAQSANRPNDYADQAAGEIAGAMPPAAAAKRSLPAHVDEQRRHLQGSEPSSLEKLLDHARSIGIAVEDLSDGDARRIWVHITEAPDNHSRKIVRRLIDLGFEFWPGKGYWR